MKDIIKEHNKKSKIKIEKDSEDNYFFQMNSNEKMDLNQLSILFAHVAQALYLVVPENQKKLEKEYKEEESLFDIPKLRLDRELLEFYMERHYSPCYSIDRQSQYSCKIESLLSEDIDETIEFLEECSDGDIENISDQIYNMCYDFYSDSKESYFKLVNTLKSISKERKDNKNLKNTIKFILENAKDAKTDDIINKLSKKMANKAITLIIKMKNDWDFPEDIQKCITEYFSEIEYFGQPARAKITTDDEDALTEFYYKIKDRIVRDIRISMNSIVIGDHKPKLWI